MSDTNNLTRRKFVKSFSAYGGCAYAALMGLGLMSKSTGHGAVLSGLPRVDGKDKTKVVIMGAGIAGLTVAYELGKLGFSCTILEPRSKAGGRCMTIRKGDVLEETNGFKQTCTFDDGHYFNPGPSRFPQWHVTMDYCRELGVPIQPFVNLNENAFYYSEGDKGELSNKRIRIREAKTDLRGYTAEMLAKVIDQGQLDEPLGSDDKEKLIDFLKYEGGLSSRFKYNGHDRRGYEEWPAGGLNGGKLGAPHSMKSLLDAEVGMLFHRANETFYQSQMFTPKGGMDKIADALASKVEENIILGAEVKEFRKTSPGVRVVYVQDGEEKEITANFGICTIPPTILRRIPNDLSPMVKNTLNIVPFQNSSKVGMQFKRRFWEEDDRIFGGLSWTNMPIGEVWYPTDGFFDQKGILGGYYIFGPMSDQLTKMSPKERIEFALSHGEKIHPQYRKEFENGFAVNWSSIPHIEGCLAHFPKAMMKTFYPLLVKPDGDYYLTASWASHLGGWQAGAFEAARLAVEDIHKRSMAS
ncbi:flavin monoamine oxidase family protein [Puniceicoccaceae bacterium K14]|nr:flavin monoamine oxidase family protein [Puniceicoccaceae bacterium K14]